jgi:predicted hydrocarbon binding protein
MDDKKFFTLVDSIAEKKDKIKILMLFLEEVGGMLTHLRNVGVQWGAAGESCSAYKEAEKYRKIAEKIKEQILSLTIEQKTIN